MRDKKLFQLTLTAVFVTIILTMSLLPQIGFITVMPGVSVTLVHIPVIVGVFLLDRRNAIILGFFMGLGSLMASYIYGATAFDLAFQLPWISVLPRMLFAWLAFEIVQLFKTIETIKLGKIILFGLVSLVTLFALFYGSKAIVTANAWAEYNTKQAEMVSLRSEADSIEDDKPIEALALRAEALVIELNLPTLSEEATNREAKVLNITTPLVLLLSVLFLVVYYWFIEKHQGSFVFIPSSFILATVIHTVLVLATVAIFKPAIFSAGFTDVISIIYGIAMTNGLMEALAAVLIGTPIIVGILNYTRRELI
ncbi:hypothetical protein N7603_04460 [Acholeplasma vituli]|uniref:ECF transporter S component n=1 Tax=Paracholeplasma vituli TaxID=69473 RepID=A0ABT2PZ13_9MOLU|nr:hypothetical protein [Paracholeplasma vituli]MCU0104903.1 hypothetical protein [Paracholeplasma vituli]